MYLADKRDAQFLICREFHDGHTLGARIVDDAFHADLY